MGIQREFFTYVKIMAFVTIQLLLFAACDLTAPRLGFSYGTLANVLPAPADVISILRRSGIRSVRIYDPNPAILNALQGSLDFGITIGIKNEDIPSIARSPEAANVWVNTNVLPYKGNFTLSYVTVGNEVIPGPYAADVPSAIRNIRSSLLSIGLPDTRISTTMAFNLQESFPPSAGVFPPDIVEIMKEVTHAIRECKSPLFVSIYPYFAYASNPDVISLEYATFTAQTPVIDGQLQYFNLLDAQMDACYAALAKIGAGDITVVVAETGWPTAGNEPYTSVDNARSYNANLVKRVMSGRGTPVKPNMHLNAYIFSLFDENLKPPGIEQHWGVYSSNLNPKYPFALQGYELSQLKRD